MLFGERFNPATCGGWRNRSEKMSDTPKQIEGRPQVGSDALVLSLREAVREFRENYQKSYERELEDADRWIKWCEKNGDTHGMNFHQGKQGAHIDLNIEMHHLLKTLEIIGQNVQADLPATVDSASRKDVIAG
jgi:hypothetical protein